MILYIDCVSEQQIMQYNQAHSRHNSTKWQGHYRNNKYTKNSELQEAIIKSKEVEDQFQHRIYQLRDLIIEEREKIINSFTDSHKQEVREMLNQSCSQLFSCEFKIGHQKCSIKQMQKINSMKLSSITHYEKQKQQYIQNKILLTDGKDNNVQLQQLAYRIGALDRQIKAYDLFTCQCEMLDQLETHKQKLLYQKKQNMQLKELLEIRQLEEKVQKNNFVVLLAKYESLSKDHEQQKKTLISLQKHRQQIQDRLKILLKEKEEIGKKSNIQFTTSKQIAECEQQKRKIMQQYEKEKQRQNKREQQQIKQYALSWKSKYQLEEQLNTITEQYRKSKKKEQRKEKRYQKLLQSNEKLCQRIKMLEQKISGAKNLSQSQQSDENQHQNKKQSLECSMEEEKEQGEQQSYSSQEQMKQIQQKEHNSQEEIEHVKMRDETKTQKNRENKTLQKNVEKNEQEVQSKGNKIVQLEKEKRIEEQREQEKENKKVIASVAIIAIIFIVLALIYTSLYP